jgi:4-amino-4-deoxy-L-arabinose transferase-like glycosyltransferase
MTTLAEPLSESTDKHGRVNRATVFRWFALILLLSFILRIAYAGHLYEDDGLWFTAGEQILRGKALYREIYFDKPPGLALIYAALFWIFGAHILTIRLFTILYTVAVSAVLYRFGAHLYDKRTGLLAAAMFAVFSTTYSMGHFQGLNTDFLMALPYTAGAFLMLRSRDRSVQDETARAAWLAVAGGALAGVAFQINPKGAFDLVFLAVILGRSRRQTTRALTRQPAKRSYSAVRIFALGAAGFVGASLPFLAYVAWTGSLPRYALYVWDWGARYGGYYSIGTMLLATMSRSAGYFAVNNTLLIALVFVGVSFFKRRRPLSTDRSPAEVEYGERDSEASLGARSGLEADAVLLIWFGVSFAGVMLGGRLFPHYFFQILPSLCLIGARGLIGMNSALKSRSPRLRRAAAGLMAVGFLFTLVRFHSRSVLLLADWARGTRSEANSKWYYEQRNREERLVAGVVNSGHENDSRGSAGIDPLHKTEPRPGSVNDSAEFLFVWGYRPEIYCWSGLLPASRYLSTQPLTGVPADVHYFGDDYRSLVPEDLAAEARAELVRDLEETRPRYIVDELGFFNSGLSIQSYPELRQFMTAYKPLGTTARFFVYVRKELTKKYRERHPKSD